MIKINARFSDLPKLNKFSTTLLNSKGKKMGQGKNSIYTIVELFQHGVKELDATNTYRTRTKETFTYSIKITLNRVTKTVFFTSDLTITDTMFMHCFHHANKIFFGEKSAYAYKETLITETMQVRNMQLRETAQSVIG